MPANSLDLLVLASRAVCSATGLDGPAAIGIHDGLITFVETEPDSTVLPDARNTVRFDDGIVLPGLVDLHAHPSLAGSRFGVDPDIWMLPRGVTTVMSQGDAGARNLDEYIRHTIEKCDTNVKLAINFCANGESDPGGRFFNIDEASVGECVAAIGRGGPHVWGISLNIAFIRGRDVDPLEVLRKGIEAAELTDRPVMFGATKSTTPHLANQIKHLRAGDVMTYCFHQGDGSIVQDGRLLDCAWDARQRGVLFDVGDGTAAFGFDVAETAISEGFLPDTISTDFYRYHADSGVAHDLPLVVSKLVAAGMTPEQCWPRITSTPGRVLGAGSLTGTIQPGAPADLCVLRLGTSLQPLSDGHNAVRNGRAWQTVATIRAGEFV